MTMMDYGRNTEGRRGGSNTWEQRGGCKKCFRLRIAILKSRQVAICHSCSVPVDQRVLDERRKGCCVIVLDVSWGQRATIGR